MSFGQSSMLVAKGTVTVGVGVEVGRGVAVGLGVAIATGVGVSVEVGRGVAVGLGVAVAKGVGVGVAVGTAVNAASTFASTVASMPVLPLHAVNNRRVTERMITPKPFLMID